MRVIHIITRFIRGGADENTLLTCNGQAARGHEVHLIVGDHHPDMVAVLDSRVVFHHVDTLVRAPQPVTDLRCLAELTRLLRNLRPAIVHTHESKAGILGRIAAIMAGAPGIVHGVHILPFVGVSRPVALIYLAMEKLVARSTHAYVDVSEGMRDICLAHNLGTRDIHHVVPSGMATERFRTAIALPREELFPGRTLPPGTVVGLVSGTLEPRKQVAEVVEHLALARDREGWAMLIAGAGPEAERLQALIDNLDLTHRVALLGHRRDLDRVIASADICLHAACNEGLPRVAIQYVLGGKPIVSTALPGIQRVVQHEVNGLLVRPDKPAAVAENFLALAADHDRRERFAVNSRAIDLSAWDQQSMVDAIEHVYAGLEARRRSKTVREQS